MGTRPQGAGGPPCGVSSAEGTAQAEQVARGVYAGRPAPGQGGVRGCAAPTTRGSLHPGG